MDETSVLKKPIKVIAKHGDDLRQDMLTLQMLSLMDKVGPLPYTVNCCENRTYTSHVVPTPYTNLVPRLSSFSLKYTSMKWQSCDYRMCELTSNQLHMLRDL